MLLEVLLLATARGSGGFCAPRLRDARRNLIRGWPTSAARLLAPFGAASALDMALSLPQLWQEAAADPELVGQYAALKQPDSVLAKRPGVREWWKILKYPNYAAFDTAMTTHQLWTRGSATVWANVSRVSGVTAYKAPVTEGHTITAAKMPWLRLGGDADASVKAQLDAPRPHPPANYTFSLSLSLSSDDESDTDRRQPSKVRRLERRRGDGVGGPLPALRQEYHRVRR